jgi:acyl-homoserine lactone acylase PvdQ
MQRLTVLFVVLLCLATVPHASAQQNAVQLQGIKDRVTIRRDERGIPSV